MLKVALRDDEDEDDAIVQVEKNDDDGTVRVQFANVWHEDVKFSWTGT